MIPHKKYMEQALALAKKGKGKVSPNPMVGCIIVKRGQIIGRGYHKELGSPHAEHMALAEAKHKAKDSLMYVTLEPCSHWGKTPPCTEQIVRAGVREVVIGCSDPNPQVEGYEILKLRGLKARIGLLEEECRALNEPYFKFMEKKLPFVTLKAGMTLDGKIATSEGKSKYITSKESLKMVHRLRDEIGVVMVGVSTVKKDNPLLDTRLTKGGSTMKLIIDSLLTLPPKAKVLSHPESVIIACTDKAPLKRRKALEEKGVQLIVTKPREKQVDLRKVMREMGKLGYINLLLEGGAEVNASMLKARLVDKVMLFTSPKLLGGDALSVVGEMGVKNLDKALKLERVSARKVGKDILVSGYL